jgi:hypothetical protein
VTTAISRQGFVGGAAGAAAAWSVRRVRAQVGTTTGLSSARAAQDLGLTTPPALPRRAEILK